jgi:hypothetical protein
MTIKILLNYQIAKCSIFMQSRWYKKKEHVILNCQQVFVGMAAQAKSSNLEKLEGGMYEN